MLTRSIPLIVAMAAVPLLAAPAVADTPPTPGPPLTTGGDDTTVLHCNALGIPGFVGAIVINRNGEFGSCRFVP